MIKNRQERYDLIDLYQQQFQPVLSANDFIALQNGTLLDDVKAHQQLISAVDHLLVIYLIRWFGQPVILKGWSDRVFYSGFAYRNDENGFTPLLSDKKATLIVTLGSPQEMLLQYGMDDFIKNMTVGTLNLVGISNINYQPLYAVPSSSSEERRALLDSITI